MPEALKQGGNNPDSAGKSTPPAGTPPVPVREQFRARLEAERVKGDSTQKPRESKPAPVQTDQPEGDEIDAGAQPLDDESGADEGQENLDEESSGDAGDQPDGEGESEPSIVVGDRQLTAKDVEELVTKASSYDADYRRKTQIMSRHRQEYQSHSEELHGVAAFFENLSKAQKAEIDKVDPSKFTNPAELTAWQNQRRSIYEGADRLEQGITTLKTKMKEARDKMLNDQAAESSEVMRSLDKRWNNTFYGELRDYAVKTKRYTAEEFADITDWRIMEGMIALRDKEEIKRKVAPKRDNPQPPAKRRSQQQVRRTPGGQLQSAKTAVLQSPNAKRDGSFRELERQQLENERRGR